ncbi:MAG: hypothetical protein HOV66_28055 [Streptomycetaceae bacterium]|nr:hypothetical protein [Streptomycetaceae bacterium]
MRQHTGRPGSRLLRDDWATAHRATANRTHTAACTIRHPGGTAGPVDQATGRKAITAAAAHYTGACAVVSLPTAGQTPDVADETVTVVTCQVTLAWDAAPDTTEGDLITITAPGPHGDPALAGKTLRVASIGRDSMSWERIFSCTEDQS